MSRLSSVTVSILRTLKFTNSNWLESLPVLAEAEEVVVLTERGLGGGGVVLVRADGGAGVVELRVLARPLTGLEGDEGPVCVVEVV